MDPSFYSPEFTMIKVWVLLSSLFLLLALVPDL